MTFTQSFTRLSAIAAGVAVAAALIAGAFAAASPANAAALTQAQISSIISLLQSFGADQTTINNVQASLNGQPTSGGGSGTGGTGAACPALSRDLQQGASGPDVLALQLFLNGDAATMVAASGAGSPGNETQFFGPATHAAVLKFQTKYNVTPIAGYVGPKTRAQIAAVCGSVTPGVPTGPGLSVNAGAQPANALAPEGATRVPFTTFTITNNSGLVQTISGITVQRTGFGVDNNFSGIVLVDSANGVQLGISKTLNSNHQATIGDNFTINPGETKTLTVAGNIADNSDANGGQIVSLQVVAVNTTAPVSGSLPINGASHTINTNLSLGGVSTTTSSFDPGANQTKNIGDAAVRFSGVRFNATSVEDLRLFSVRWRQAGTASASDLGNVVTIVNGVSYPTMLDASGRYYTTAFPGGLLIPKGQSIDVYIQGDIIGSNVTDRTVVFDIDRVTDVYFVGQLYGYGVAPSGTWTPWYDGKTTTINAGTAQTISRATEVISQNIAVNVSNQPLGGFATDFKGESVSVQTMTFTIGTSSAATGLLTDVTLVNSNGAVVSGPADTSWVAGVMKVTLSDTVTFPTGRQVYTLRGKIPSGATSGAIVQVTVDPTNWTNVIGQSSGSTVSLSSFGTFTLNAMTVKGAALTIALSSQPSSQSIVADLSQFTFAKVQLDASQSGEDIRVNNVNIEAGANVTGVTGCQLWDGASALTNAVTPVVSATDNNFVLNNSLIVTKGTTKTLDLKCNLSGGTGSYTWTLNGAAAPTVSGVTSGNSFAATNAANAGGTMTVGSASLAITVDPSSPAYTLAAAGQTGVTLGVVKARAENDTMTLKKLGLTFTSGVRDSVSQVYLYDGGTQIGTVTFVGANLATSSDLNVTLMPGVDKQITVKGDLATITTGNSATTEGALVKLDPSSSEALSSSGLTQTGATAGVQGVRIYKAYPIFAQESLGSTGLASGNLLRFKVTATNGPIGVGQVKFSIATSSVTIRDVGIYVMDAGGQPISQTGATSASGLLDSLLATTSSTGADCLTTAGSSCTVSGGATVFTVVPATNALQIPSGSTYTFEVRASNVGAVTTSSSATTKLLADTSASPSTGVTPRASVTGNFKWSPNATTTAGLTTGNDWTNAFGSSGLSADLIQTRSQ